MFTPLDKVHPVEAEIAANLLLPYRNRDVVKSITISGELADELEMRICEALVKAHEAGVYNANRIYDAHRSYRPGNAPPDRSKR